MKRMLVLCMILLIIVLAGCEKAEQKADAVQEEPPKAEKIVTKSQIKFNMADQEATEEVIVEKVEPTMEAAAEWCKEGSEWKFSSASPDVDASAQWVVKGLMTEGEYAGLCHVLYTAQTPMGESTMDYYFDEEGESGYFEMKLPNGQTVKQEWHG
ncbi:hypothetical protein KY346_05825 [Candidatus Woesearchaeota archaeon]|nr:hypothetical protein [Candidatus Woesearchaeota archaeon]